MDKSTYKQINLENVRAYSGSPEIMTKLRDAMSYVIETKSHDNFFTIYGGNNGTKIFIH